MGHHVPTLMGAGPSIPNFLYLYIHPLCRRTTKGDVVKHKGIEEACYDNY